MLNLKDGTLWQWDTGRKLVVTINEGHTIDKVQFHNGIGESAQTGRIEITESGEILAHIPDGLLQYPNNLSAYLMTIDEDGMKTVETYTIIVNPRAKPEDYVFTNDEILTYREYDDRLKFIENDYVTEGELLEAKEELTDYTDRLVDEQCAEIRDIATKANTDAANALEIAETSEAIAKGRNRAHVFAETVDMKAWLSTEENRTNCLVGDNLYIEDVGVPDWWISKILEEPDPETGYYFEIAQLETQKVDISEITNAIEDLEDDVEQTNNRMDGLVDLIYPVGSIYMSVNNVNPATFLGGTWEQIKDKLLLGAGSSYSAGSTGGAATTTLATNNLPSHNHTISHTHNTPATNVGGGGSHTHTTDNVTKSRHILVSGNEMIWQSGGAYQSGSGGGVRALSSATQSGNVYEELEIYFPKLTMNTVANHAHTLPAMTTNSQSTTSSGSTGSGKAFNNMPPYLTVYMWKRTA